MNKYKEKVLNELTNRILECPYDAKCIEQYTNAFVKVYNLPDKLIIYKDGDHIPRID